MTNFDVKVTIDTICPWCFLGKKRLEKGIAAYKAKHPESNDTFTTTWYPFYLDPDAPKIGEDKREWMVQKFGRERSVVMEAQLKELGKEAGIVFSSGGKKGHTRDSHRLIQLGRTKGEEVQSAVVEQVLSAYWEKEKDITSQKDLLDAGVLAGLDHAEVEQWLKEGKGGAEVDKDVQNAFAKNITGVPHYSINGQHEIGGAQEPATFVQIFERLKKQEDGR